MFLHFKENSSFVCFVAKCWRIFSFLSSHSVHLLQKRALIATYIKFKLHTLPCNEGREKEGEEIIYVKAHYTLLAMPCIHVLVLPALSPYYEQEKALEL